MNEQGLPEPMPTPHRERITIALLMLWTAMSAVLLALSVRQLNLRVAEDRTAALVQATVLQLAVGQAIISGAGGAAIALHLWRRFQGGPKFPVQPGHWILVIAGLVPLISYGSSILVLYLWRWYGTLAWPHLMLLGVSVLTSILLYAYVASTQRDQWRRVFLLCAVLLSFRLLVQIGSLFYWRLRWWDPYLGFGISWIVTFTIIGAAVMDWSRRTSRDSLHWAGVSLYVLHRFFELVTSLAIILLRFSSTP
jgi:hypothetical protein